jgi:hypothetical protein
MSAYQRFLDFFSMHNKERLDGLDESYFSDMNQKERDMAFGYLLKLVRAGGTEESMHALFRADSERAVEPVEQLLNAGTLNKEAQIAAAWNLREVKWDDKLLSIFICHMTSFDHRLRSMAAYYVPPLSSGELKSALRAMIRVETVLLPLIHAVNKLFECSGVTEDSIGEKRYLQIYRNLRSDDLQLKERAFKELEDLAVDHQEGG